MLEIWGLRKGSLDYCSLMRAEVWSFGNFGKFVGIENLVMCFGPAGDPGILSPQLTILC